MRLFLAVELGEEVKQSLYQTTGLLAVPGASVKRIAAAQLHVTLKFLGHTGEDKLPEVKRAADESAAANPGFDIVIEGGGCFPPHGKVRIVWAGITEGAGQLARLAACCENYCGQIGFPPEERVFSPHLTLARVKEDRSKGAVRRAGTSLKIGPLTARVNEVVLFQSIQKSDGSYYEVLHRSALK